MGHIPDSCHHQFTAVLLNKDEKIEEFYPIQSQNEVTSLCQVSCPQVALGIPEGNPQVALYLLQNRILILLAMETSSDSRNFLQHLICPTQIHTVI